MPSLSPLRLLAPLRQHRRALCLPTSWATMAAKELKGADVASLTRVTAEGIDVKPLYTAADLPPPEELDSLPGQFPFTRGPYATMYTHRPCAGALGSKVTLVFFL